MCVYMQNCSRKTYSEMSLRRLYVDGTIILYLTLKMGLKFGEWPHLSLAMFK